MKNNIIAGIILIIIGILIILHQNGIDVLSRGFLRSGGLILLGIFLFSRGVRNKATGLSFIGAFLFLTGVYYAFAEFQILTPRRGLNLCVYTAIIGLSFYANYFFNRKNISQLLAGNIFLILGIFFLLHYLGKIPPAIFVEVIDRYWPVFLILIGLGLLIQALTRRQDENKEIEESI